MKFDAAEGGKLYRPREPRPIPWSWGVPFLLLLALLFVHGMNTILQWTVIRQDLSERPAYRTPDYTFLGFAPFQPQKIADAQRLPNASPAGRIFAFFDWLHPAVFLIWNNGREEDFFDLGPVVVSVPPGFSRVAFFPGSVFSLRSGSRTVFRHFGGAIVGRAWHGVLAGGTSPPARGPSRTLGSFVVKHWERSTSLHLPYLLYFLLPLALIAAALASWGAAAAAAFLYYVEMFFLFDYGKLFVTVPFGWLFRILGLELSEFWIKAAAIFLVTLFLLGAVFGLWHWKRREASPWMKRFVLFLLLLPAALFL
ncbi:MAG: hypothetical protein JXO51_00425 [Candidatus Aminicenantes bacterium]|nr:hypothetical protein [Candidatus Aminicenantes bacterium]